MTATVDVSAPDWGHKVEVLKVFDGGKRLRVAAWLSPRPGVGDFLILPNDGATTRYRVASVERCRDPKDMLFADLVFAPRS